MTLDVDRLSELLAKATPGPWRMERTSINAHIHQVDGLHWLASCVIGHGHWHSPDESEGVRNAELIVAAVNALPSLLTRIAELEECAQVCANKFREYQINHHAKRTRDGDQKAARNAEMAEMCEALLSGSRCYG